MGQKLQSDNVIRFNTNASGTLTESYQKRQISLGENAFLRGCGLSSAQIAGIANAYKPFGP